MDRRDLHRCRLLASLPDSRPEQMRPGDSWPGVGPPLQWTPMILPEDAGRDRDEDEDEDHEPRPGGKRRCLEPVDVANELHRARVEAHAARLAAEGHVFEGERWWTPDVDESRDDEGAWSLTRHDADRAGLRVLGPLDVAEAVRAALAGA